MPLKKGKSKKDNIYNSTKYVFNGALKMGLKSILRRDFIQGNMKPLPNKKSCLYFDFRKGFKCFRRGYDGKNKKILE